MHICLLTQEYPPETNWGGIATYSLDMAEALQQLGHQVSVIALSTEDYEYTNEQTSITVYRIKPSWAKYYSIPGFRHIYKYYNAYPWRVFQQLKKIHRQKPIDIIETPNLHGEALFWQLFGPKIPVVVRLHSSSRHNRTLDKNPYTTAAKIDFWHEKIALRKASGISAVSQCIVNYNKDLIPSRVPLRIIGNPLALNEVPPKLGAKEQPPIILYVGRLSQRKGFPTLVKAIPHILKQNSQVTFTIAGKDGVAPQGGSMWGWAQNMLANYSHKIHFLGMLNRKEVTQQYQRASVVVFPTRFEPFGYISLEAMAHATILVASNLDGPAEVVKHEQTGLLFEPDNEEDLARMVNKALSANFPREEIQKAAWLHVKNHYSQSVIAQKTEAFYQEILGR